MHLDHQVATLTATALAALLHTLLPSHWLCFSLMARAKKWTLKRTLALTTLAGMLHVVAAVGLGVLATLLKPELVKEESHGLMLGAILAGMGILFLVLHLLGKGHSHEHDVDRVAVTGLVLLPALSPCTAVIAMFLAVLEGGALFVGLVGGALLLVTTLAPMLLLVTLSYLGIERIHFHFLDRYEKAIIGLILCLLAIAVFAFH